MDLKSILSMAGKEEKHLYWSLTIEPGWVQAGIWEIAGGKAQVSATSPSTAWETEEELIGASDTALSSAIQHLPEESPEPEDTVFGLNSTWVSQGNIKAEYLEKIRRICQKLSLKPVGFVVLPEAISHLLKSEEGSPLSAVVLGVGKETIEVSLFKLGSLVGVSQIARSVSIVDDVSEGLTRFATNEAFPSRFVLYNGKEGELEEVRQALINVSWEGLGKIKFLHTPKVEIIAPERKILAVSLAGASEIADVSGVITKKEDMPEEEPPPPEEIQNIRVPEKKLSPEELGFAIGKDVSKTQPPGATAPSVTGPTGAGAFKAPAVAAAKAANSLKGFLSKIQVPSFLKNFKFPSLPALKLPFAPGKNVFAWGLGFLAVLLVLGFGAWWFLPTATVTIYVSPQNLEEKSEVLVSTGASSVDFSKKMLPGKTYQTQVSSEKTASTTGTKTVGEKAKGGVEIRNGTATDIALPAGTTIFASNDLKFTLDSAVTVSAAVSPSSPGTATADVSAFDIGAEYNLAKDESFRVGNYPKSEVDATATADFSGGSSSQISAVSEKDLETLEEDLTSELLDKADGELSEKVSGDEVFIASASSFEVAERTFNNKVGDEADTLKLSMSLDVTGIAVSRQALTDLAKEILKDKVPQGYVLRDTQITADFELEEETEDGYLLSVLFKANLLPETKTEEIAKNIAGKYPTFAKDYLTSISGFSRAEITIKPAFLPSKLKVLPRIARNINIEIEAER
jgi:hypothetical protein